jgi:hypothetical protein
MGALGERILGFLSELNTYSRYPPPKGMKRTPVRIGSSVWSWGSSARAGQRPTGTC